MKEIGQILREETRGCTVHWLYLLLMICLLSACQPDQSPTPTHNLGKVANSLATQLAPRSTPTPETYSDLGTPNPVPTVTPDAESITLTLHLTLPKESSFQLGSCLSRIELVLNFWDGSEQISPFPTEVGGFWGQGIRLILEGQAPHRALNISYAGSNSDSLLLVEEQDLIQHLQEHSPENEQVVLEVRPPIGTLDQDPVYFVVIVYQEGGVFYAGDYSCQMANRE